MNQHRLNWFVVIFAASTLSNVIPAAGEGGILIDQRRALEGGITPGDGPGFPITISQPGRYNLASHLHVPPGQDGFSIATDDVTIDFNGFVLNGHGKARMGVSGTVGGGENPVYRRWTMANGTILRFQENGIWSGIQALIDNMRIIENGTGINSGGSTRVFRSTISKNDGYAVLCKWNCLIEGNIIVANGWGLMLSGTVLGNTIMNNKSFALVSYYDGAIGYGNNTIAGNNRGGPQVEHGPHGPLQPNYCGGPCQ